MGKRRRWVACTVVVLWLGASATGEAQDWQVEIHGGGQTSGSLHGGVAQLPAPGSPFVTSVGRLSRRVPSWLLGDGSVLLNAAAADLGVTRMVTPLDAVLTQPSLRWAAGGLVGVRVARTVGPRLSIELSVDYGFSQLSVPNQSVEAVGDSAQSYEPVWRALLATGPFADVAVTVDQALQRRSARQLLTTGALVVRLPQRGPLEPFVTGGVALASTLGASPALALETRSALRVVGQGVVEQQDRIAVRWLADEQRVQAVLGGGLTYWMTSRSGLRLDLRLHLGRGAVETRLDATPGSATLTPSTQVASISSPSIQLSNDLASGFRPTLSDEIRDVETFAGRGWDRPVMMTVGWVWRL